MLIILYIYFLFCFQLNLIVSVEKIDITITHQIKKVFSTFNDKK